MRVTRNPVLLDHDGPELTRPAPMLGEHSEEVLRGLDFSQDAITQLAAAGVTRLTPATGAGAVEAAE
jgi:crotonobetainyl-CoA:carnitine CoA-transferase CaiB-like acyl-CoA transferase